MKELGIRHAVFITDIHVRALQLTPVLDRFSLCRGGWKARRCGIALRQAITSKSRSGQTRFTIAWPAGEEGKAHFFLEADRGTMAHSRMREKITGYAAYFHQQRHMKKFEGMKRFRVATITETRGRAQGLVNEFRSMMRPEWLA